MIAPKYINTRLDIEKYNRHVQSLHKRKLREIQSKCSRNSSAPKLRKKPKEIITKDSIYENKKLLRRLLEISQQKNTFFPSEPILSTLNFNSRKKESERIDIENKRIVRKIKNALGYVRQDSLEKAFSLSQEYKSRISRSLILKKRMLIQNKSDRNVSSEKTTKSSKSLLPY